MKTALEQLAEERMETFKNAVLDYKYKNKYTWEMLADECELNAATLRQNMIGKKLAGQAYLMLRCSIALCIPL